jgi:hypothetical protein
LGGRRDRGAFEMKIREEEKVAITLESLREFVRQNGNVKLYAPS